MSLSARDESTLESIKERLAGSDPALAGLLGMFTTLVAGEDMPVREPIRAGQRQPPRRGTAHRRTGRLERRLGFQQTALLLWLVISVSLVTVALVFSRGSGHDRCAAAWPVACVRPAAAHNPGRAAPSARP